MKNFLSVKQLDREKIEKLLISAMEIEKMFHAPFRPREFWSNKTMASFFGEASTRTRISFERAMHWLGGSVVTAADASASSSLRKGESIRDTLYTLSQYSDVIVFRHPDETWINEADAASVPVINAGNGSDEHPTQAMLDLLTIYKKFGRTSNLKFLFCGDLHPLPRRAEIHTDVDEDHRAVYKDQQIRNGLYIRIAILKELLNHV
jgi:aspartate carbamoyltransferase catalytic subunit